MRKRQREQYARVCLFLVIVLMIVSARLSGAAQLTCVAVEVGLCAAAFYLSPKEE
jgi:hypothetical protein